MAGPRTFTAPNAFITIGNKTCGYVRTVTFTENTQRATVRGLGSLAADELPPVALDNQFSCDMFFLDFSAPGMQEITRNQASVEQILNTLSLGDFGFTLVIYRKTIRTQNNAKIVTEVNLDGQTVVMIPECLVTSKQFSLSTEGIAGYNVSGVYREPVSTAEN